LLFVWIMGGGRHISYWDLGCSFVRAVNGSLRLPNKAGFSNKREYRRAVKKLGRYYLITRSNSLIDLGDIPAIVHDLDLSTFNPRGKVALIDLVSSDEVDEMERDIVSCFIKTLPEFDRRGLLIGK